MAGFLDTIMGARKPVQDPNAGYLDTIMGAIKKNPNATMSLAAQLLAAAGPRTADKYVGLGEAMGNGINAYQQTMRQGEQDEENKLWKDFQKQYMTRQSDQQDSRFEYGKTQDAFNNNLQTQQMGLQERRHGLDERQFNSNENLNQFKMQGMQQDQQMKQQQMQMQQDFTRQMLGQGQGQGEQYNYEQYAQGYATPEYLQSLHMGESSGGKNMVNPSSNARGHYQFMPSTAKQYQLLGDKDLRNDFGASSQAAAALANDNAQYLAKNGIEPTTENLLLAHQQGMGGAVKLLSNPNARATDIAGEQAVLRNGGNPNMTAGEFAQQVTGHYTKHMQGGQGQQMQQMQQSQQPQQRSYAQQLGDIGQAAGVGVYSPQQAQAMAKTIELQAQLSKPEPNMYQQEIQKGIGQGFVANVTNTAKILPEARSQVVALETMQGLLNSVETGAMTNFAQKLNNMSGGAIKLSSNASKEEALSAYINWFVPQMRETGSGSTSDMEMKNFRESLPSLMNTVGGNKIIMDNLIRIKKLQLEEASNASMLLSGQITQDEYLKRDAQMASTYGVGQQQQGQMQGYEQPQQYQQYQPQQQPVQGGYRGYGAQQSQPQQAQQQAQTMPNSDGHPEGTRVISDDGAMWIVQGGQKVRVK